jgi:hypothetical protein
MRSNALGRIVTVVAGVLAMAPGLWAQPVPMASPLRPVEGGIPGLVRAVQLDPVLYAQVKDTNEVLISGFPLGDDRAVDLRLERFEILAPDAQILDGAQPMPRPDLVLLRGEVADGLDSQVFLALSPLGCNGFIRLPEQTFVIAAGRGEHPTAVYDLRAMPPELLTWSIAPCGGALAPEHPPRLDGSSAPEAGACRTIRIAVDSDFEYFQLGAFGGNAAAAQAYISTLMAGVSEIYRRDINAALSVTFSRVWSTNTDPYPDASTVNDRLNQLQAHWNAKQAGVSRNIAHLLTGRNSGAGGVAYVGVLCQGTSSYGTSGYLGGSFPNPLVNNNWGNWDIVVAAHEIGHNFNAPHTHAMTPPVDGCGNGDCTLAAQGTIMSYCHTCSGGLSNINLTLQSRVINETILPYLGSGAVLTCVPSQPNITFALEPVDTSVYLNGTVTFSGAVAGTDPVTLQWRRSSTNLNNGNLAGATVSGATTPSVTITNVQAANQGTYSLMATNSCGSITTRRATLTVVPPCATDYNKDFVRNLDDLGDYITDFYTTPAIPGGVQPAAPTIAGVSVGFGVPCPDAPDAPAPYSPDAYRTAGYRVGYSSDGSNRCPPTGPNLDNLGDFITAFYAGC